MKVAAYCRVSTDKSDQLNSLEAQKAFFDEYTAKNGHNLVKLYADEGISGTKIKNRRQFLRLMEDARSGLFDMVVVKDISRFARNTVDLLNSTRQLKALNIETLFLTSNMTVLGNSEFVLTIFGALAQEESAGTSKRVKFGKRLNAEKGRVPNLVYGYDKTAGDYFNLRINEDEAEVVRSIYSLYTTEGIGAAKIAGLLNEKGLKTKRGSDWTQTAVSRILSNPLYTGKIINGKEEVADFLTGRRRQNNAENWIITNRPQLMIIKPEVFARAKALAAGRRHAFTERRERHSSRHLFSTIIKCAHCGHSFRRLNKGIPRWVCGGRSLNGADSCPNKTSLDESMLMEALGKYFTEILSQKGDIVSRAAKELAWADVESLEREKYVKNLTAKLAKARKSKAKYLDMYDDDLITREELGTKVGSLNGQISLWETELAQCSAIEGGNRQEILKKVFSTVEDIVSMENVTNTQLKEIIEKIVADDKGNVDIYLRPFEKTNRCNNSHITYNGT